MEFFTQASFYKDLSQLKYSGIHTLFYQIVHRVPNALRLGFPYEAKVEGNQKVREMDKAAIKQKFWCHTYSHKGNNKTKPGEIPAGKGGNQKCTRQKFKDFFPVDFHV